MCSLRTTPVIGAERLALRPLAMSDAPWIAEHAGDFDVARMTTRMPHPYALDDARNFLARLADPLGVDKAVFGIQANGEGLIGVIGFHADDDGRPEVGYWLGKPWWGKGYATEALRAALKWAKSGWGRKVIYACHFADNPASGAVLVKAGFLYTGDVRPHFSVARGEKVPSRHMVWLA